MADYSFEGEFIGNVVDADDRIFNKIGISDFVNSQEFKEVAGRLSLYPSWLIDDDIFSIIQIIYGFTDFAQHLKQKLMINHFLKIALFIVPQSVISLYDHSFQFLIEIPPIREYLQQKGVHNYQTRQFALKELKATDIGQILQDLHDEIGVGDCSDIVILFDRRDFDKNGTQELVVFESKDLNAFHELRRNNLMGIGIEIDDTTNDEKGVVRVYLNYGICQRIRFYPEFMVSVVPKLFLSPSELTEYEALSKLYSSEYKHGWRLRSDDYSFNSLYKAITGTTHETNNYYRPKDENQQTTGCFLEFANVRFFGANRVSVFTKLSAHLREESYDSDATIQDVLIEDPQNDEKSNIGNILRKQDEGDFNTAILKGAVLDWEQSECGKKSALNFTDCLHCQRLVVNLQKFRKFRYVVNNVNVNQFNLGQIIRDFDHLMIVHEMFSGDDTERIQQYIARGVQCDSSADCVVVNQFRNRRRESETHRMKRRTLTLSTEEKTMRCEVLHDTLCSVHCYLLHRTEQFYRLSDDDKESQSRFTSAVTSTESVDDEEEKGDAPLRIDFGISVLRWLPYGVDPQFESLREEMVQNEDSPLSHDLHNKMEIECIEKIKGTDYTLDEMVGLKYYSDLTAFTASLRKAHWKSMPIQMKRRYYHWARSIYLASLRFAKPIPIQKGNTGAKTLYHGLNALFRMDVESPTYFGPFSTTVSQHASDAFSEKRGLRLNIQSGYEDTMKRSLGINMQCISSFKHEQEVLLVDQPIPIKGTKLWESEDDILINHLLYSLKTRIEPITDRKLFFRNLGMQYNPEWAELIGKHEVLYAHVHSVNKTVLRRLSDELGIFDVFYHSRYCVTSISIKGGTLSVSVMIRLETDVCQFDTWDPTSADYLIQISNVAISDIEVLYEKRFSLSDLGKLEIQPKDYLRLTDVVEAEQFSDVLQRVHFAVSVRDPFGKMISIKRLQSIYLRLKNTLLRCRRNDAFHIDECVQLIPCNHNMESGGNLILVSSSSIVVDPECGISALNFVPRHESMAINQKVPKLHHGHENGVISFAAFGCIVNYGILQVEAPNEDYCGGLICMMTESEMINNGQMSCGEDGKIVLWCNELVNEGAITPIPTIQIMDKEILRRYINIKLQLIDNNNLNNDALSVETDALRMGLDVLDHRGHFSDYHPRNLLVSGTVNCYDSQGDYGPLNEDWITFKQQTEPPLIAMRIGIRNGSGTSAIKRLSIECSVDGTEFEEWIEIKGIEKGEYKPQIFDVDLESIHYAMDKKWRFYKLRLLENYGNKEWNEFYEFIMFGIIV